MGVGSTTICATLNGKTVEIPIVVRGILVVSSDDGVSADNLPGNMDLPTEEIDEKKGVSLELEVDKLDPKDWKHWGQLKKIFEEILEKTVDCSDAFDITVSLKNGSSTWKVQPIEGKRISIWMPVEDAQDISKRHLMHVKDDGTYEEIEYTYEPIDGVHGIRFETESFSSFVLLAEASSSNQPNNGNAGSETKPADPTTPTTKPADPTTPTTKPAEPTTPTTKPAEPTTPTTKPADPTTPTTKPAEPTTPTTKPAEPTTPTTKPADPTTPTTKPTDPTTPTTKPTDTSIVPSGEASEPSTRPSEGVTTATDPSGTEMPTRPENIPTEPSELDNGNENTSSVWVIVFVAVILLVGGGAVGWFFWKKKHK